MERRDLRGMSPDELRRFAVKLGEKPFRGEQVFEWIYKGKTDFREMDNLPKAFRAVLDNNSFIGRLEIIQVQKSSDGTRKYLFGLPDGNTVESVFMRYSFGSSICVSSQAGCRMGCRFCASSKTGLMRSLTAGEIMSQIIETQTDTCERVGHVVIMGTGEPFDNYESVAAFIRTANEKKGLNISMRNITVSTCGIVPGIDRFGDEFDQVNLAISLHSADDSVRSEMMPVNRRYNIAEVISACRRYIAKTNRRVTFEYTLICGVNDSDRDASKLASLLSGMLCHVNVITLNETDGSGFETVSRERAAEFRSLLESKGIAATIRRKLGSDIDAACGQLRANSVKTKFPLNPRGR